MINLNKLRKGAYGRYAKIGGVGHKFIGDGFKTKQECVKSRDFYAALKECTYLKISEPCKISPKFISIDILKVNRKYFPVIKMDHIPGRTLLDAVNFNSIHDCRAIGGKVKLKKGMRLSLFIKNRLTKVNINHEDLHSNNIMILPDKSIRVVDFGDKTTSYLGHKKLFLSILKQIRKDYLNSNS